MNFCGAVEGGWFSLSIEGSIFGVPLALFLETVDVTEPACEAGRREGAAGGPINSCSLSFEEAASVVTLLADSVSSSTVGTTRR